MDRARQLQSDIDNIQTTLIQQEKDFNTSSIYYQDVYLRFSQQLGYATLDELVADVQSVIKNANLPGSDIFDALNDKADAVKSAMFASTAVALGGGVGHGILGYRQQIRRRKSPSCPFDFILVTFPSVLITLRALQFQQISVISSDLTR